MVLSQLNDDLLLHQNKLCERLYKDKSNMARILSVLEEKGLIEKIPTKECKHVNKIKITEKGDFIFSFTNLNYDEVNHMPPKRISFVDELQNLFFFLSGSELTVC